MQSVQGDPAALVAATLVQAEMALRGGRLAGGSNAVGKPARQTVAESYEYYLQLVVSGTVPSRTSRSE